MSRFGVFRFDPPPPQRGPFTPIPAQGQQPPNTGRSFAQFMALAVAAWPTGMEPGLPQPDYRSRIAPLTLVYGQQPPVQTGTRDIDIYSQAYTTAWQPPDPLPTLPQRRYVAPQTLVYGDFPPPPTGMLDEDVVCWFNRQWQSPDPPPQRDPKNIAPLTLAYGDQPPVISGQRDLDIQAQVYSWAWQPPDPLPTLPQRGYVVPLALVYGQQPPLADGYQRVRQRTILGAWDAPDPLPVVPQYRYTVIPPLVLNQPPPFVNYWLRIVNGQWQPPDPQPQRDQKTFAPLTLVYGDAPPPFAGMLDRDVMMGILQWQPPPPQPSRDPKNFAPLTLVYGDQPPRISGYRIPGLALAWQTVDPLPTLPRFAVPFSPIVVTQVVYDQRANQRVILAAWEAAADLPPRERKIAPLTLTYGQQPPRQSIRQLMAVIAASDPAAPVPAQRRVTFVPVTVIGAAVPSPYYTLILTNN